ncbi:MAG: DUF192 domain-containing protein [Chloroflexota bacterium]|nr:DUF192 domain-containing protein [Chloroflexota bacterium]
MTGATIRNLSRGTVLATQAGVAQSFWARLVGLIGRAHLPQGAGLLFPGTPSVHTCFMRFPIDLVFYGADGEVLSVVHALPPWRVSRYYRRARGVLELPVGTARTTATQPGDVLAFDVPLQ